jgi:hypothetical protein
MVNPNTDPSAFPANGTYSMQQAWRLYFDKANLKRGESYTIQKNYPAECSIMCGRAFKAIGMNVNVPNPLTLQQKSFIDQIFNKMLDHPYLTLASSCVFSTGMISATVFFLRRFPSM